MSGFSVVYRFAIHCFLMYSTHSSSVLNISQDGRQYNGVAIHCKPYLVPCQRIPL